MKSILTHFLLTIYTSYFKKNKLRKIIKEVMGSNEIIVKFNGFKIYASKSSAIETSIIFDEYSEQIILDVIKKYALKGYNLIDIGANIGLHSITAAMANNQIEILSFEPEPLNFLSFTKNIALNDINNIRPFKMGLGNFKGNNVLNINPGWNKGKHSMKVNLNEGNHQKIIIPVTQLDVFKDNIERNSCIIKIDVEGFEKEVLEGAHAVLNKLENCVVIIELISDINGENTCEEITSILIDNKFKKVYKILDDKEFIAVDRYEGSANYVFLKGDDAIANFKFNAQ